MRRQAREPVSWPVMPTDLTEGDWSGMAGPTSKLMLESRWPCRCPEVGQQWHPGDERLVKVEKSSARGFEAETTMIFVWGRGTGATARRPR
jgi:hypothetical protein